jgi:hypothetical protein
MSYRANCEQGNESISLLLINDNQESMKRTGRLQSENIIFLGSGKFEM